MTFSVLIFMCLLGFSLQKSTPEDNSYVAAVVEFEVRPDVDANLAIYVDLIKDATNQNADIIVFPELTLSNHVSVTVPIKGLLIENPIPALAPQLFDEIMVNISSAARENEIYVVINAQEIVNCTVEAVGENCPENKTYYFNTNVVFDRQGAVIDRYRKINLFGEFTRTPALTPDLGVFTTDFGVTFGHFICFDLMFQVPAVQVVEKNTLMDIIFTTMWFSEMPYLTAVQIQEAYAYAMNVNFLAAGANNVQVGSAGSGIFSGKAGALVSIMPGVPTTRLLVSRVPKVPGQVEGSYPGPIYDNPTVQDNLTLITDPSLASHVTRLLKPGYQEFTLIDKDTVCHFRVNLAERNDEKAPHYRAFVTDGINIYGKRQVGNAACVVVACETEEAKSCVYKFTNNNKREVKELDIKMTSYRKQYNETLKCDNIAYYPVSLRNNKFPLSPKNFSYFDENQQKSLNDNGIRETKNREHINYRIKSPQDELVSFGVWARIFTRDDKNNYTPSEEDIRNSIESDEIIFGVNSNMSHYVYRASAFSGVRSFTGVATGGMRACSVFACSGNTIETCGKRFPQFVQNATAVFEELSIIATVPTPRLNPDLSANNSAYFAISLDTSIMPLKPDHFEFNKLTLFNIIHIYTHRLVKSNSDLYSFGVWGREYTTDGDEESAPIDHDDGTTDDSDDSEVTPSPDKEDEPGSSVVHKLSIIILLFSVLVFIL